MGDLLNHLARYPGHLAVLHHSPVHLVHVEQGRLLADHHPTAHEVLGQSPVFQVAEQVGLAAPEIAGYQHSLPALRPLSIDGEAREHIVEGALHRRLATAQSGHRITIGHAVSQGLQRPAVIQS